MKRIVLDPGHGGDGKLTTYGATGNGLREKDLVLEIAFKTKEYLERNYECEVFLTRDRDYDSTFTSRSNMARDVKADLLVSLHMNGFKDHRANGFESFIYGGTLRAETINNQHKIHDKVFDYLSRFGVVNRGKKQASFAMLRLPPCSCVLLEYVFITNERDATVMKMPNTVSDLGMFTAIGIAEGLGLKNKSEPVVPPSLIEEINNLKNKLEEIKKLVEQIMGVIK